MNSRVSLGSYDVWSFAFPWCAGIASALWGATWILRWRGDELAMLVFHWVYRGGHPCCICPHWGECGSRSHDGHWPLACSAWERDVVSFSMWCGESLGDFQLGDVRLFAVSCWLFLVALMTMPLAMLCFHLSVKKRASPPMCTSRIQNVFQFGRGSLQTMMRWFVRNHYNCDNLHRCQKLFNKTLGYPGEGPKSSVISANVDSCATNVNCLQWDADAFFLQEARITEPNMTESRRKAAVCNFDLYCSQSLQKLRASNQWGFPDSFRRHRNMFPQRTYPVV